MFGTECGGTPIVARFQKGDVVIFGAIRRNRRRSRVSIPVTCFLQHYHY